MSGELTVAGLRDAVSRILAALDGEHERLTALDGQIGDGDLGITLLKALRVLDRVKDAWPDNDLGQAFMQGASAVSKVSSSSFGTLLATSLMTAAKATKGEASVPCETVPSLLGKANEMMMSRGKASLGDKTVLDAVNAAAKGMADHDDRAAMLDGARTSVNEVLAAFRDKPNKIGRARIFADRTVGLDDPGMAAFKVMLDAL